MTNLPSRLFFGDHTDPGPRPSNQDTVLTIELPDGRWLAAVADGMGGLAEGERAGKTALARLYRSLSKGASLTQSVQDANAAVHRQCGGNTATGTTLVAAILDGYRAEIVNVGDSRAYHLDPLGMLQITRDHTMGEEAVRSGDFLGSEVPSSLWTAALSRFLGADEEVQAEVFASLSLQEGDWLLLCSDGLHRVVSAGDMEKQLRGASDPRQTANRLVEMALERDTEDNVSVVLVYRPQGTGEKEGTGDIGYGFSTSVPPDPDPVWLSDSSEEPQDAANDPQPGDTGMAPGDLPAHRDVSPNEGAINLDPGTIFIRSSRHHPERRSAALTWVMIVGLIGLLLVVFLSLTWALSQ